MVQEKMNAIERAIADMWTESLDIDRPQDLSPDSNFFDLGGHSLLANLIGARVNEDFGVDIDLEKFFEKPTIKNVAQLILEAQMEILSNAEAEKR